ncbi:MAG: hypothetical protein J0H17_00295 [Rhizobiales bacterium]|nr:hypothetical protein [Hyphomicrobiales bacterium]
MEDRPRRSKTVIEMECLHAVRSQAACREIDRITIRKVVGVPEYNWEPVEFQPMPTAGAEEAARDIIAALQRRFVLLGE